MVHRRLVFLLYLVTIWACDSHVEGVPNPLEYLAEVKNSVLKRIKRSSVNFHRAIHCYQPNVLILGTYGNYGCFCGFSGHGRALDETDKCCQAHDNCYEEAESVKKTFWESLLVVGGEILQPYEHECVDGEVLCAKNSPYRGKLCECDKIAAACFEKAYATYHPGLYNIDTEKYCKSNANLTGLDFTTKDQYKSENEAKAEDASSNSTFDKNKAPEKEVDKKEDKLYHQLAEVPTMPSEVHDKAPEATTKYQKTEKSSRQSVRKQKENATSVKSSGKSPPSLDSKSSKNAAPVHPVLNQSPEEGTFSTADQKQSHHSDVAQSSASTLAAKNDPEFDSEEVIHVPIKEVPRKPEEKALPIWNAKKQSREKNHTSAEFDIARKSSSKSKEAYAKLSSFKRSHLSSVKERILSGNDKKDDSGSNSLRSGYLFVLIYAACATVFRMS